MNVQNYRAMIAQLVPINSLSQKHFDILLSKAELVELAKNRVLFRRGDVDKSHFYLLEGELRIEAQDGSATTIDANSDEARHPLAQHEPRQHTAKAATPAVCLKIESKSLDMMLAWDNASNYVVEEITPESKIPAVDWMGNLLKAPVFQKVRPANLQALFMKLERVTLQADTTIISQGAKDEEDFYIVGSGEVDIVHTSKTCPEGMLLATLAPGEFFGAEALISNQPRSASAVMKTDGGLMRLSKKDFLPLVTKPVIKELEYGAAAQMLQSGKTILLDVRLPVEHQRSNIRNSVNFPLIYLHLKHDLLDRDKSYICYCDTGGRSAAAAFLLQNYGFDAYVLKGGMQGIRQHTTPATTDKVALA